MTARLQLKKNPRFLKAAKTAGCLQRHETVEQDGGRDTHTAPQRSFSMAWLESLCWDSWAQSRDWFFLGKHTSKGHIFLHIFIIIAAAAQNITWEMWQSYRPAWSNHTLITLKYWPTEKVHLPAHFCNAQGTGATWLLIPLLRGSRERQAVIFFPASSQRWLMTLSEWWLWLHVFCMALYTAKSNDLRSFFRSQFLWSRVSTPSPFSCLPHRSPKICARIFLPYEPLPWPVVLEDSFKKRKINLTKKKNICILTAHIPSWARDNCIPQQLLFLYSYARLPHCYLQALPTQNTNTPQQILLLFLSQNIVKSDLFPPTYLRLPLSMAEACNP